MQHSKWFTDSAWERPSLGSKRITDLAEVWKYGLPTESGDFLVALTYAPLLSWIELDGLEKGPV